MTRPAAPTIDQAPAPASKLPPNEEFWKRYSPHYEFPLSTIGSVAIHGLLVLVLVLIAVYIVQPRFKDSAPLPMDAIVIAGGGGSIEGIGDAPGDGAPPQRTEEAVQRPETLLHRPTNPSQEKAPAEALQAVQADPLQLAEFSSDRMLEATNTSLAGLSKLSQDTQRTMLQGLATAGKGQGGSGSGGGKGAGHGKGTGELEGDGKGHISVRQKRLLRWTMEFNVRSGGDEYLRQLAALGAILAIPDPRGGYRVGDLARRPVQWRNEDLAKLNRIFWIDSQPETVASLCAALGIRPVPPQIVAFFPHEMEKELLAKELRFRGRNEDDIKETKFEIVRRGGGRYEPIVSEQH